MELNRFMSECTSICPETTHQKLESQRVYLSLFTMELYMRILCGWSFDYFSII